MPRPADATTTPYHYVITLQWFPPNGGIASNTQSGVVNVPEGTTRKQVWDYLWPMAKQTAEVPEDVTATAVCFALERDELERHR